VDLRKEHVVLAGALVLLGGLAWKTSQDGTRRRPPPRAKPVVLERHPVPDTVLALPERRERSALGRDLFSPPSDTRALPLLPLETPPLPRLGALEPPPSFDLSPRVFGRLLRADPTPGEVLGLFADAGAGEEETESDLAADPEADSAQAALEALKKRAPGEPLSAEQRAGQVESWKKLYDWLKLSEIQLTFGQIRNADRFGLAERSSEPILFAEVDPETGLEKFPGAKPPPMARERVLGYGFADTPSNRIQLRRRELHRASGVAQLPSILEFAEECVRLRLQAREALQVAEEMFQLAAALEPDEPTPQLGLARCYEAGFELEKAYEVYLELLERYAHRPEVHVRLAELEARLRLFDSAEERLRHAERIGRGRWDVAWSLGRFFLQRARYDEAVEPLRAAFKFEPGEAEAKSTRAGIRADLGAALLARGEVDEALQLFDKALQADPRDQRALAGRKAALRLGAREAGAGPPATPVESPGFDLLVSDALAALEARDLPSARDQLELATEADPLRAYEAWRALSWVAEIAGYPEEAFRFVELAQENHPSDAWTLYQRGRLAAERDDQQGARESFLAALDVELDFTDALVSLGDLSYRAGGHRDAERYFERALLLDPKRPEVHALRGLGRLETNDLSGAEESFRAALALQGEEPLARIGVAWVRYRRGESASAIQLFAELNDARRALPESDPYRRYAKAQVARIQEHESKVAWSDRFERKSLKNGWEVEEAAGPLLTLDEGELVLAGAFKETGKARLWRPYNAGDFVSLEMDVTVSASNNCKVGVFIAKERRVGAGELQVQGMVSIARRKDGGLVVLLMDKAQAEPQWEDVPPVEGEPWWPADRPVRLRIEKTGEGTDATGRLSIDGIAVRERFPLQALSSTSNDLRVGLFAEGDTGLPARVVVDDVEVVYKLRK